jgi:hypothetical protein
MTKQKPPQISIRYAPGQKWVTFGPPPNKDGLTPVRDQAVKELIVAIMREHQQASKKFPAYRQLLADVVAWCKSHDGYVSEPTVKQYTPIYQKT